jgi:hypothetical protein
VSRAATRSVPLLDTPVGRGQIGRGQSRILPGRRPAALPAGFGRQVAHEGVEFRLRLEADAGAVGQAHPAILYPCVVGVAREGAEDPRTGLAANEAEPADAGQRHLVAAAREDLRAGEAQLRLAFRAALRNSDSSQVRIGHSSRPAREEAMRRNDERHG